MGEAVEAPETEDEGDAEVDNGAAVIDPEENPEATPEEVTEETSVETPEETPADNGSETEEPVSSGLGMEVMAEGDTTEQTITVKVMKGTTDVTASKAATVEYDEGSVTESEDKVTVIAEKDIKFTITYADEIVPVTETADTKVVTATAGGTAIAAEKISATTTNNITTCTITNGTDEAALTGNVEITINVADKTYTVSAPTNTDSTMGITWNIKKSTDTDYPASVAPVTVIKSDSVTVQATLAKGKDAVAVTVNGETKKLEKVAADAPETTPASTAEFTVKVEDLDVTSGSAVLTASYVLKKVVTYTVTADKGATVSIVDAAGKAVTPEAAPVEPTATETKVDTYKLTSNETYLIKIAEVTKAEELTNIESVKVGTTAQNYNGDKNGFEFTTGEVDNTITVKVPQEKTSFNVTFEMEKDQVIGATVKADAYKNGAEDTDTQTADAAAAAITGDKTYAGVWKGTDFSFELAVPAADAEYYEVKKVETSTDGGKTWTTITGTDGKYTIKAISADTKVKVSTDFKTDKVYSIKFTADDDVKEVKADLAGGSTYAKVDLDKVYRIKAATGAAVTFQIATETGYKVDKLSYGSGENDKIEVNDTDTATTVYTYNKFAADKATATINISTKAIALTEDKYVKFVTGDGVTLDVKGDIKTEKKDDGTDTGVYKLTMAVPEAKDAEGKVTTPAVAEISELKFDLSVPYGSYLDKSFAEGANAEKVRATTEKRVKSTDGKTWTYSYKVVANLVPAGTTPEAPEVITIDDAAPEEVILKLADGSGSVSYWSLDYNDYGTLSSTTPTAYVSVNETVILAVGEGQTLKVNDKAVELDVNNKYRFDTELDDEADENETTYEIEAKSAADYTLQYKVGNGTFKNVGEEPVEVEYNDTVALQLKKADGTAVAIADKKLPADAKSLVTLADQTVTANKGQATVTVRDADVTVTLCVTETKTVGNFDVVTKVDAASITFTSKDASGKVLTVKGITKGGSVKLDATSETSYALTLKEGKKTLNAAEYDKALTVDCDDTKVKAVIEGGKLIVKPLVAADAEVTIKAAADNSELFKFTVKGQTPALKVKSVTSVNQGMHDILLDMAADASIKTISDQFALYYEVTVAQTAAEGASTNNKDGVYYLPAVADAKGKIAPVSQLFQVNAETDNAKMENEYSFTVRLVAVNAATDVTTAKKGTPASGTTGTKLTDEVKFFTADAKTAKFKTRKAYYEDKLGVTKKTTKLYSGQQNVVVAIPKFSKNASYIDDIRAAVYNKDGSQVTYGVTATVDPKTLAVSVTALANYAGTYDVVIEATAAKDTGVSGEPYKMYRASAKVPITVQKGINSISVDCPTQVAVLGKKDSSITLKTAGWFSGYYNGSYSSYTKAQTQKFLYELDEDSISNPKNKDKIIVKNNKVTVKNGFKVGADPEDNTFSVTVYPNDYGTKEENKTSRRAAVTTVDITVTDEALVIGSVKLVVWDDENDVEKELPATITTQQLEDAYVSLTDGKGKWLDPSLVTLTPNKGKVYVNSWGGIAVNGYQKNLTIKAVTKDGGKKSKSSVKYTINYPTDISYDIKTRSGSAFAPLTRLTGGAVLNQTGNTYTYLGHGNDKIDFYVTATTGSGAGAYEDYADTSLYNYSVKVIGGKPTISRVLDSYSYHNMYSITPTAKDVKIEITDKTKKAPNNKTTFTFTDNGWERNKTAAPTASTKGKLYAAKDATTTYGITQDLTYTVKFKNNVKYNAVKLTKVSGVYINAVDGVKTITNDGTFKLTGVYATIYNVGTAKYSAVYGDVDENNVFVPKTKAATLSIKVNKANNPKAVNKYTINPKVSMSVPLAVKPALAGYEDRVKFIRVVSANNKGEVNNFYDNFEVVNGNLQIKADKWTKTDWDSKKDLTGYLEYQYYDASTGNLVKKQDKITVVISDKTAPKYTASDVNIVAVEQAAASTVIKLGGTAVSIAKVATDSANWDAERPTSAPTGVVMLKAKTAPVSESVNLYVIPADAKTGSGDALTAADPLTDGILVKVKVTVKAADDSKSKITIAKGVKTPVASIDKTATLAKVNLTVELQWNKDFTCNLANATIAGAAKTDPAQITDAAKKKAAEAVNTVSYANGKITIVLDRDKLDDNKQYNIPVDLTFTAGAKETVYFTVKTEKIPTKDDIKKLVEDKLKDFAVSKANFNNATAAAAEVEAAANAIDIPALSGIEVTAVAAKDAATFADNGETKGDHKIKITLTDVTKAADATDKTVDVEITVTEKVAAKTVGDALKAAIEKYVLAPGADGKVPDGKILVTKALETDGKLQSELQAAVDAVAKNKYYVRVSDIVVATETVAAPAPTTPTADDTTVKVTNLTFDYEVLNAMTGRPIEGNTKASYSVNVNTGTIDTPPLSEDAAVNPNPGPTEKVVASIEITSASATVAKGGTQEFTAKLLDAQGNDITADKKADITWSLAEGKSSNNTALTQNSSNKEKATLTVGTDETATSLTVTAAVGTVTKEAAVTVTDGGTTGNPDEE